MLDIFYLDDTVAVSVSRNDDGTYSYVTLVGGNKFRGSTDDVEYLKEIWSNALEKFSKNLEAPEGALSEEEKEKYGLKEK